MQAIREPLPGNVLAKEVTESMRILQFKQLEILAFRGEDAPKMLQEIARIREQEFRIAGAGRGLDLDLDEKDQGPYSYRHLISWDPVQQEIVAAYRFIICGDLQLGPGFDALRTSLLFNYSETFKTKYLARSIELGRSVVNKKAKNALVGLFSVWAGLGALLCEYSFIDYFFGNFTIYKNYSPQAVEAVLSFLELHHSPSESLIVPRPEYVYKRSNSTEGPKFSHSWEDDFEILLGYLKKIGEAIPPILLSYLGSCRELLYLGCAIDSDFGDALECAIVIPKLGLNKKTKSRFIETYKSINPAQFISLREGNH